MPGVEELKAELAAIDSEDRVYWQTRKPGRYETLEYFFRQERRPILLAELLELIQGQRKGVSGKDETKSAPAPQQACSDCVTDW